MLIRHATTSANLDSILTDGLLVSRATGKEPPYATEERPRHDGLGHHTARASMACQGSPCKTP